MFKTWNSVKQYIDRRIADLLAEHESDMEITVNTLAKYGKADVNRIIAMAEARRTLDEKIDKFQASTGETVAVKPDTPEFEEN